jgi:hypothetical protein
VRDRLTCGGLVAQSTGAMQPARMSYQFGRQPSTTCAVADEVLIADNIA